MVTKKASKKKISSAMKDLEDALLNSKNIKTKNNRATVKKKIKDEVLILTDIIEVSPYKNMNYKLIIMKKSIQNIVKSDIQNWIKHNMPIITSDTIKKSLDTIKYIKK